MRSLSIFTLLAASCSLASATVISSTCVPNIGIGNIGLYAGGAGTVTYNCAGVAPGANFQIISAVLTGTADYLQGSSNMNTFQVSFAVPAGFSVNPIVASATGMTSSGTVVPFLSSLTTVPLASFAAFNVISTGTTPMGSVAAGSGVLSIAYTVEAISNTGGVPEPSTLALVGGVLVLAGLRKSRS